MGYPQSQVRGIRITAQGLRILYGEHKENCKACGKIAWHTLTFRRCDVGQKLHNDILTQMKREERG